MSIINPKFQMLQEAQKAIRTVQLQDEFFTHLKKVGYYPHAGQLPIIKKLMKGKVKRAFVVASRNFGKSTVSGIDAVFHAGLIPNSKIYIIAPTGKLAKEIYWASGFLLTLVPPSWLGSKENAVNISELRITFRNGSFIKLDSADNEASVRGYKPTRLICDEFQDWKTEVWNGMQPNLLAHDATCIMIGTPPDRENHFTAMWTEIEAKQKKKEERYYFAHREVYSNPLLKPELIEELRLSHLAKGESAIWRREFLAQFVAGGAASVLPMFSRENHVRPKEWIQAQIASEKNGLQYYTVLDPSGTRFGVGFFGYNPYTGNIYVFDEIIEKEAGKISASQLIGRILEKEREHYPENADVVRIYDEAARLFALECADKGFYMIPTQKKQNEKSNNISLLRDVLHHNKIVLSDICSDTIKDFYNYHTDENGKIVKKDDEGVDVTLYMLAESGYTSSLPSLNPNVPDLRNPHLNRNETVFLKRKDELDFSPQQEVLTEEDLEDLLWN